MDNKKIINEIEVQVRGKTYKEITYEDGETILRRFDEKSKMWVTLHFTQNDDSEVIQRAKEVTRDVLLSKL